MRCQCPSTYYHDTNCSNRPKDDLTHIKEILQQALANRERLLANLIGDLYPTIVRDEITKLKAALEALNAH